MSKDCAETPSWCPSPAAVWLAVLLLFTQEAQATGLPFTRGVNLTGWLQAPGVRQVQFSRFTRQDLFDIRTLGFDVIRLPVNLPAMTGPAPDHTVAPLLFFFLDQIVDWAEEHCQPRSSKQDATRRSCMHTRGRHRHRRSPPSPRRCPS